jgi:hypothetical protein
MQEFIVDGVYITRSSRDVASLREVPRGPVSVSMPLTPEAVAHSLGSEQPFTEYNKRRSTTMFMNRVAASLSLDSKIFMTAAHLLQRYFVFRPFCIYGEPSKKVKLRKVVLFFVIYFSFFIYI